MKQISGTELQNIGQSIARFGIIREKIKPS
jgi:hypothetical protein